MNNSFDDNLQKGWLGKLEAGLTKSSLSLTNSLNELLVKKKLDSQTLEEIEDVLITADLGVETARKISKNLASTRFGKDANPTEVRRVVADEIIEILSPVAQPLSLNPANKPHVILVCGVNGSGKTTTVGKLAHKFVEDGKHVILAAGDTFRAAATEQLKIWGEGAACHVISKETGSDPAGLVFEAFQQARKDSADVLLIDTAGLRKKRRVKDSLEYFSVTRSAAAIKRCDITVLVVDAETGIVEQDKKIADLITKNHRACIVVINKWDLATEAVKKARKEEIEHRRKKDRHRDDRTKRLTMLSEFGDWVQEQLFFLDYAPVIFTSATSGFHLDRLLEAIRYVADQWQQQIPTPVINRVLQDAIEHRQPPSKSGKRFKLYYATQTKQSPPTFTLFVNAPDACTDHYTKYLTRHLRKAFGFEGCPLRLLLKHRPKSIKPIRKYSK